MRVGKQLVMPALAGLCAAGMTIDAAAQYSGRVPASRNATQPAVAGVSGGRSARAVTGASSLSGVRTGLSAFAADMGRMPTSSEGLNALIVRPPGATNWRGPYISITNAKAPFTDPWGMQYRYTQTPAGRGFIYTIASNGPDRVAGTRDDLQIQF